MVELAGSAALVIGDMSGMAGALGRALVAAGARVALVDVDAERAAEAADALARAGGTAIAVPRLASEPWSLDAAVARAEAELGSATLHCDVTSTRPDLASAGKQFVACRWASLPGAGGALTLSVRPLTGLAAMALLVPGSLSTRPACSSGVLAARLFGPHRDLAVVERSHSVLARSADVDGVAGIIVGGAVSRRLAIMTLREWNGSAHQNVDHTMATLHTLDDRRGVDGAALVSA